MWHFVRVLIILTASTETVTESLERISCGGTAYDTTRRSILRYVSMQGMMKIIPGRVNAVFGRLTGTARSSGDQSTEAEYDDAFVLLDDLEREAHGQGEGGDDQKPGDEL